MEISKIRKDRITRITFYNLIGFTILSTLVVIFIKYRPIALMIDLIAVVSFTTLFFLYRKKPKLSLFLTGIVLQLYVFAFAAFLSLGNQIEIGLGIFVAVCPIYFKRWQLWFFVSTSFILYHIVIILADYDHFFILNYFFFLCIFIIIKVLINENRRFEQKLIIQNDQMEEVASKMQELNDVKSRFFTNVSHDLRTPLTLILGPLKELIRKSGGKDKNHEIFELMERNSRSLLTRINELLDLDKIDAHTISVSENEVFISSEIRDTIALLAEIKKDKQLRITYDNALPDNRKVIVDRIKLDRIISNLLGNAVKFTPDGGEITVMSWEEGGILKISIKDSGIGIKSQYLDKIFDRFYRVETLMTQSGSGIGLALSKEFAKLMGGDIEVKSVFGEGSTFTLNLPYQPVKIDIKPILRPSKEKLLITDNYILIVEDNLDMRQYIKMSLDTELTVKEAKHGQEAMDCIKIRKPELIISDIMMPVMDGMQLLRNIKESDEFRHIPMIMLTAIQSGETRMEALRIGVDNYLTKPFTGEELQAIVVNLLKTKSRKLYSNESEKVLSGVEIEWLKSVEEVLTTNIGNPKFTLQDGAKAVFLSPRRFQQKIKEITGMTPKQYQRSIQLEYARTVLKSGAVQTLAEISAMLGFQNPNYFSKLYTEAYGKSPLDELK